MAAIFSKQWMQNAMIYGGITIFILLIIFGVTSGIKKTNSSSVTTEEVHWHAPISYEACGQEVDFDDEKGHTLIHGHNDDLVHVEGVVMDEEDVTLASYFKNSGIDITSENFEDYQNGDLCNFSAEPGMVTFYINGEPFTDPNDIIVADKQEVRVVFE